MEESSRHEARVYRSRIDASGRMVLPSELRDQLGLEVGSAVVVVQDEHGVHIETPEQALGSLRAYFKGLVPEGVSLVDELIAERRAEAKHD